MGRNNDKLRHNTGPRMPYPVETGPHECGDLIEVNQEVSQTIELSRRANL